MSDPHSDAFGRLVVDPAKLSHAQRVDIARGLSGTLQAADDPGLRWLGAGLGEWLRRGGDLAAVLGLRPDRGSRGTAQEIMRRDALRGLLLRLVNEVGSQSRAARILSGAEAAPAAAAGLVAELSALRAPRSLRAIAEAVRPHPSGGRTA